MQLFFMTLNILYFISAHVGKVCYGRQLARKLSNSIENSDMYCEFVHILLKICEVLFHLISYNLLHSLQCNYLIVLLLTQ